MLIWKVIVTWQVRIIRVLRILGTGNVEASEQMADTLAMVGWSYLLCGTVWEWDIRFTTELAIFPVNSR